MVQRAYIREKEGWRLKMIGILGGKSGAFTLCTPPSSPFASSVLSSIPNPYHRDDRDGGDSGGGGSGGGGGGGGSGGGSISYRNLASISAHPCSSVDGATNPYSAPLS